MDGTPDSTSESSENKPIQQQVVAPKKPAPPTETITLPQDTVTWRRARTQKIAKLKMRYKNLIRNEKGTIEVIGRGAKIELIEKDISQRIKEIGRMQQAADANKNQPIWSYQAIQGLKYEVRQMQVACAEERAQTSAREVDLAKIHATLDNM